MRSRGPKKELGEYVLIMGVEASRVYQELLPNRGESRWGGKGGRKNPSRMETERAFFSIPAFPSAGKDWEREKKKRKGALKAHPCTASTACIMSKPSSRRSHPYPYFSSLFPSSPSKRGLSSRQRWKKSINQIVRRLFSYLSAVR